MARDSQQNTRFPESFFRTSPVRDEDTMSDESSDITPPPDSEYHSHQPVVHRKRSLSPPQRISRSSVMRLENILNDVSIAYVIPPRSRSVEAPPAQQEADVFTPSSEPFPTRSESPTERIAKKKKVKMHKCPECNKDFPRPSGLRTHMNMHTKEKPFACNYPGCSRSFSVVSNAKRHMRTHGLGVPEDASSDGQIPVPYVIGFEAPVVVAPPEADARREPVKLRWVPSASSSADRPASTRSSSGQGVGKSPRVVLMPDDGSEDAEMESEGMSRPSSKCGGDDDDDDDDDNEHGYVRRRVESER